MIQRLLLIAGWLPVAGLAQLQLLQFDGTTETAVGNIYQLNNAAPGDKVQTRFRLRNNGTGPVTLVTLSISGQSYQLTSPPSLGYIIASSSFVDFTTTFSPADVGTYSANLQVNSIAVIVRCTVVASAILSVGSSNLAAGAIVDFGKIQWGTKVSQSFVLANPTNAPLTIASITVTGTAFQGPSGITPPLTLTAGQPLTFQIVFAPPAAQTYTGTLTIAGRAFLLTGLGLDPPLPNASIQIDAQAGASAHQTKLSIALDSVSKVSGTGTLAMEFHPSVTGVTDDPSVLFLSGPARIATVTFVAGESIGRFGSSTSIPFQTGTTAGAIIFTLKYPNPAVQANVTVAPAPITLDTASGTGQLGQAVVSLVGFDNTHSASQMKFTFYDTRGKVFPPGQIAVDVTQTFATYFSSTSAGSGAFALRAVFPVTGGQLEPPVSIRAISNASPGEVTTATPHGYITGDQVYIQSVGGMVGFPVQVTAVVLDATHFTIGLNTTNLGSYSGGGTATGLGLTAVGGADVEITNSAGVTKTQRLTF